MTQQPVILPIYRSLFEFLGELPLKMEFWHIFGQRAATRAQTTPKYPTIHPCMVLKLAGDLTLVPYRDFLAFILLLHKVGVSLIYVGSMGGQKGGLLVNTTTSAAHEYKVSLWMI